MGGALNLGWDRGSSDQNDHSVVFIIATVGESVSWLSSTRAKEACRAGFEILWSWFVSWVSGKNSVRLYVRGVEVCGFLWRLGS